MIPLPLVSNSNAPVLQPPLVLRTRSRAWPPSWKNARRSLWENKVRTRHGLFINRRTQDDSKNGPRLRPERTLAGGGGARREERISRPAFAQDGRAWARS